MSKTEDLEKLDRVVKDADIRLRATKSQIDIIDREMLFLDPVAAALEANVKFLKRRDTIAIAGEFKKTKDELGKARVKLAGLKLERARQVKLFREIEVFLNKYRGELDKLQKSGENNVLTGKFGRKDNG